MVYQAVVSGMPSASALLPDVLQSLQSSSPLTTMRLHRLSRYVSKGGPSERTAVERVTAQSAGAIDLAGGKRLNTHHLGHRPRLPDCLVSTPIGSLRSMTTRPYSTSSRSTTLGTNGLSSTQVTPMRRDAPVIKSAISQTPSSASRASLVSLLLGSRNKPTNVLHSQIRSFSSTPQSWNQNQLAHAERTANNNPTSATAQNTFYTALLRANMPKLVIERYETGRYASNAAADSSYLKALQMTGTAPASGASMAQSSPNGLSSDKLQAVGQAIAGQVRGGQMVRPGNTTGTGAKEAPLYVVVEESWGSTILKWVKTFLWVGLAGYFLLVILTLVVEATGSFRTRTGQNNEVQPQQQTVRFSDVHGCDEAKEELQELVEFLINPDRFNQLGGKLPKGVLLTGPPGTGKTMLARAVAGEAGCPVFYMSGSEFDELYVGVGAKRVRDLFSQARNKAPSIIFIDELDAVGGKRNARDPAYAKQTLNQLLTELDGFSPSTGVILIAATNYPEALDKALTRPGRFDRRVVVPLPDVRGRIEILKHHMKNVPITGDVDATNLARATSGMSGADLANLVNQAAVHASRLKHKKVTAASFEWAKDKIMMGAEVKSRMVREKDKIMTAYHEAGHCLVNLFTPNTDQLYKMTIIPRGQALGVTHQLPPMDEVSRGYDQYLANIDVCMGGRAAEELVYGPDKVTSGITSDLSSATSIAHHLVTRCGYSKTLGNIDYTQEYAQLSSETKQQIEREVRELVEGARQRADKILKEKRKELEALKDALLEYETLDKAQIDRILRGEKLEKIEVELRQDDENNNNNNGPKGNNPQEKRPKETSSKGGLGIKLPDVLLPPGTTGTRGGEPEGAR